MANDKPGSDEDISDDEIDQIIEDISKEEAVAKPTSAPLSLVQGEKMSKNNEKEQALTLELTGVVNLKLCFSSGERSIELICTEEALLCRMADGTEFRIPTGIQASKRNAA
jgi:hypothetical protein